jgi:hypothetical protein
MPPAVATRIKYVVPPVTDIGTREPGPQLPAPLSLHAPQLDC